jgi:DnaJ-class molecular chaperone
MFPILINSCRTCNSTGFVWRGRVTRHETLGIEHGKATVHDRFSHIKDICPECHGTGVTSPRKIQRTPWELAFRSRDRMDR